MSISRFAILVCSLIGLLLTGCASDDPAKVVEDYFTAIINDDIERLAELTCAEYENEAITAAASFRGTGAQLQDMQCSMSEDYNIVQCQGKIVVSYGAELREFPLGRYRIVQEDGLWRVCGEA